MLQTIVCCYLCVAVPVPYMLTLQGLYPAISGAHSPSLAPFHASCLCCCSYVKGDSAPSTHETWTYDTDIHEYDVTGTMLPTIKIACPAEDSATGFSGSPVFDENSSFIGAQKSYIYIVKNTYEMKAPYWATGNLRTDAHL